MIETLLYYLTAFGLGAAHALEPGHGKTLVTAYLTGARAKLRDAVLLGILVTIFHTASVFVLGVGGVYLFRQILSGQENLNRGLDVLSGAVVLGIGLMLFWRRFVQDKQPNECECHLSHVHDPADLESKAHDQSFKEVIGLGIASGLSPCPMALAALVASLKLGGFQQLPQTLFYLLVFSMGLGAVLVAIGFFVIGLQGSSQLFVSKDSKLLPFASMAGTLLLIGLGTYLVIDALIGPAHA